MIKKPRYFHYFKEWDCCIPLDENKLKEEMDLSEFKKDGDTIITDENLEIFREDMTDEEFKKETEFYSNFEFNDNEVRIHIDR